VVDADGLFVVNQNLQLVQGYTNCVLTPNVNELARLPPLLPTLPADFSSRCAPSSVHINGARARVWCSNGNHHDMNRAKRE